MTDRKQALIDLRDKVKAGEHTQIPPLSPIPTELVRFYDSVLSAYHGSLDAAHALHEAVLPEYFWAIGRENNPSKKVETYTAHVEGVTHGAFNLDPNTPARAWLLAILEAMIAEADQ